MIDYGNLVYLDVQKTGSSFVRDFLEACCRLNPGESRRHAPVRSTYGADKVYFTTVRHPLALYSSLYRYGLDGNGVFYERLKQQGKQDLYRADGDGFDDWLAFMLDPKNVASLGGGFAEVAAAGIGLQSFRFLSLSFAYPLKVMRKARSYDDLVHLYEAHRITREVLRNETLAEDLRSFALSRHPEFFDADKVDTFLSTTPRINASTAKVSGDLDLSDPVRRAFEDRERFLLETFYS